MKRETLVAVKGSVNKWKNIDEGHVDDNGGTNCNLCQRFGDLCTRKEDGKVEKCPVYIFTGETGCDKTPYSTWSNHQGRVHDSHHHPHLKFIDCKRCSVLVKQEIAFLEALIPVKKVRPKVTITVPFVKVPYDLILRFEKEKKEE